MIDLVNQKKVQTYPRMTALKSLRNTFMQNIIRIVGLFLRRNVKLTEMNLYQKIVYCPVAETVVSNLNVKGEIPKHLYGLLLRIGSNPIYAQDPSLFEWYLGAIW